MTMRDNVGLFKGIRKDNGDWVEGFYVRLFDFKGNISHRIYNGYAETKCGEFYPRWAEVYPETLCEYAGCSDTFGNRIFEGDIVHCMAEFGSDDLTVFYEDGKFRMKSFKMIRSRETWGGCFDVTKFAKEVIGNVYDNYKP